MNPQNPPPPKIGDVFEGPWIGHGTPKVSMVPGKYYVRAVVDAEEDATYGWLYQVVFRFYTRHKGWRYTLVPAFDIGLGAYKKVNKRQRKARTS